MTNQDAVTKAISIIKAKTGTIPVYPFSQPGAAGNTEMITVNTLGVPIEMCLQKGILNVNISVPDVSGYINNARLYAIAVLVRSGFTAYNTALNNTYRIWFVEQSEMVIQEEGKHILNIRYNLYMLNN